MEMVSIKSDLFSTRSGKFQPDPPLSDSDQDRPPSNKDQTSRTRILNRSAAGLRNLSLTRFGTRRKKPSGGGGSGFSAIPNFLLFFIASGGGGFSAIPKFLLSFIARVGGGFSAIPKVLLSFIACGGGGFSAISKALLSLIPSGGGGGVGYGGGCGGGCGGFSVIPKVLLSFISSGGGGISAIPKIFIFFIAIFPVLWIVIPSSSTIMNSLSILHQVPEGHVGVYWRGGALLKTINDPGFHLKLPFITRYEPVQVTLQTDQVRDIPCGTKGGVMINFEKIVVVNRLDKDYVHDTLLKYGGQYDKILIYEKIHQEINQFCNSHSFQQVYIDVFDQIDGKMKDALQGDCRRNAPGIEIISVHVTKPTIPESISRYYEQLEEERIKGLIATEKQRVVEKEAETNKNKAISEAENSANVRKILMEQNLMEKDSVMKQQEIENQIYMAREKSLADAYFYRESKKAEANKLKLTPEYLELIVFKGILVNKNRSSEENVAIKKISSEENVFVYSIMFVYMCARRLLVYFL